MYQISRFYHKVHGDWGCTSYSVNCPAIGQYSCQSFVVAVCIGVGVEGTHNFVTVVITRSGASP